jgi:hypothetical protein
MSVSSIRIINNQKPRLFQTRQPMFCSALIWFNSTGLGDYGKAMGSGLDGTRVNGENPPEPEG